MIQPPVFHDMLPAYFKRRSRLLFAVLAPLLVCACALPGLKRSEPTPALQQKQSVAKPDWIPRDIKRPVYYARGRSLFFPVNCTYGNCAGIVRLDLAERSFFTFPGPCGHSYQKLAILSGGRILAAWSPPAGEGTLTNSRGRRTSGYAHLDEIVFFSLPDGNVMNTRKVRRDQKIEDISAPGEASKLFLSVRNWSFTSALPDTFLVSLDPNDWSESIIWPGPPTYRKDKDDWFHTIGAPEWEEPDGRLTFRVRPSRDNKIITQRFRGDISSRYLLLNERSHQVTIHPQDAQLKSRFGIQKLGDTIYNEIGIGNYPDGSFIYGLQALRGNEDKAVVPLGYAPNWIYVFDDAGERYVLLSQATGQFWLIRLRDQQAVYRFDADEVMKFTTPKKCGVARYTWGNALAD